MPTIRMAGLSRTHTGRYIGRKVIPPECRAEYARRFGPRHEAKFSLPSTTEEAKAKEKFAAWLSKVEAQIASIRNGQGANASSEDVPRPTKPKSQTSPWKLFEHWVKTTQPAQSTIGRWRYIFEQMQAYFGDRLITPEEARTWIFSFITPERSARTVREICLSASKTVYALAVDQGLIASNPFLGIRIKVPRRTTTRDSKAFTWDEAATILVAAQFTEVRNTFSGTKRWAPWLLAYSGARGSEICQLRGQDVFQEGGRWFARITPEAGTTKTKRARTVPIHEHLIEQGFLDFIAKRGKGPLFYDPPASNGGNDPLRPRQARSFNMRQRLGHWIRFLGINHPEVPPTHGFRHLFKQICDRAGITERISDTITGHSPATVGRSYGAPTASDLAEAMKKFPRYEIW